MDCRETQPLLVAFHDGELPAADRARVEEHLRGCAGCRAMLADLARADRAADVPDPEAGYWDRFNARVMDRVDREAATPTKGKILRPNGGWMRRQFRYLVPAAAAAALVGIVVRYGGMPPDAPAPYVPSAVSEPVPPDSAGSTRTKTAPEALVMKKTGNAAVPNRTLPPVLENEKLAAVSVPSPPPTPITTFRGSSAGVPPATGPDGMSREMQAERRKMAGAAALMTRQEAAGKAKSASAMRVAEEAPRSSPCELARALGARERWKEAETAQRACLAGDLDAPSREKGLVYLAELLDRQARFTEADAVIMEIDRLFPQGRPLDLYRQRRPHVQQQMMEHPVPR